MPFFVEVILPLALPKTFTYQISEAEFHFIKKGMRVVVPFGKSKLYTALVLDLHQNQPLLYEAKEIDQILDEQPIVSEIQIEHWKWMAQYYMCSLGEVYRGAMPSSLLLESETIVTRNTERYFDASEFTDDEFLVYQALQHQSSLKIDEIVSILNKKKVFPILYRLLEKQVLSIHEEVTETYKPKLIKYIRLHPDYAQDVHLNDLLNSLKGSKQTQLMMHYFQLKAIQTEAISVKQLTDIAQVSSATVKSLIDKGVFEVYFLQKDRVDFTENFALLNLELSAEQQLAKDSILEHWKTKEVCLLHGVTGSGKTEVYIELIKSLLEQNKQVLYLLPEIALTTQLVDRLRNHFGGLVSVYHSKYSNHERVEVWRNVLQNASKAQIVIGARSALFLPFKTLGCVIIDEEHEQTFKQHDPAPRYHARDTAIVLAAKYQAKVLLGSATPSLESYFNAQNGKYGLVELMHRFGNFSLPEIELVDLKDKYFRKKMTGHFSDALIEEIQNALANKEQIILFQNRRGYSPVVECMICGHVAQCPQCDVSLTYHKHKNQLRCHYCGYSMANPSRCHSCSGVDLETKGFGTEQVQQELEQIFPQARIIRMDQDTTRAKYAFEKIIDSFKNHEADILIGTQMLAKGLDFEKVSLVGIMNADNMLYHPDFRAFERSFQLMTQVSGRAGRSEKSGKVMIQTYNPYHNIIQQVTRTDYLAMYREQLYERKIYQYPPYTRLVRLTLKHRDFEKLKQSAQWLTDVMKQHLNIPVLGPEEPPVGRIRNEYIRLILIKIPQDQSLNGIKKTIQKILDSFDTVAQFRAVKVSVNVDFY
ncbi:primosomal protein N' [Flavobacterium sp. CYK-55]|uniref:replication restart helicase PriA n=1 Tax=Flavobacterium sp. CYK-55 TaxID=2835529 RepID=UPI001BD05C35|nr:primosomal protein N' [Flavobacterium sp. CYK-55]MBS7786711.1 primosomal protein N' [Flavobacterium sp. CYK-55]